MGKLVVLEGALACMLLVASALPSQATSSTLSRAQSEVSWDGTSFAAPNAAVCLSASDPTCDHHLLEVNADVGDVVRVSIDSATADDLELFVYTAGGKEIARSVGAGSAETVVFHHRAQAAATYEVRVQPTRALPGATYRGTASLMPGEGGYAVDDLPQDCVGAVPDAASLRGITDDGGTIGVNLLVLTDGIDGTRATAVLEAARTSFAPLGLQLTWSISGVSFTGTDAQGLINQAKAAAGGTRPAGYDAVAVLTAKNITSFGATAATGAADCVGGVAYADRAFVVVEGAFAFENTKVGPLTIYRSASAKIVAHELGHIFGADHHQANCVEGAPAALLTLDPAPCTVMFNAIDLQSFTFGVLEGAIVRGHAVAYARP
ncbi:MAG TPA: zinc-dependent metalloprotease family protein [Acidimicrobiales bacterium]|nr:zinc-dependent metalloprotease family protein [Acidimicrobiales bacterium]